ncbi:hypothetical protein ACFSR7_32135 [Cohnella sp. GCM10020058]
MVPPLFSRSPVHATDAALKPDIRHALGMAVDPVSRNVGRTGRS